MAKAPKMVMRQSDVTCRLRLLENWDFLCVVCGHGFRDISSVTFEHIVPKSLGGRKSKKRRANNPDFAPSHFNCNQLRGNLSLLEAARLVKRRRIVMGERDFLMWINKAVPHRIIAPEFMATPVCRPLMCFQLPEHLPGM